MKYIVVLGDGMADYPIEELGGRTPLDYAFTPTMDEMAKKSEIGLAKMIPEGMKAGSDTANLAVLGYNPKKYYSGRSPLEALSIGVDMEETDISLRCNLVTLSQEEKEYGRRRILDHSGGEISTEEAAALLEAVKRELESDIYHFYVGTGYRHLLIWKGGRAEELVQPHDIPGRVIGEYLPENEMLRSMMEKSYDILSQHPINAERKKRGVNPANSCWFWGAGTKPRLTSFEEKTGKRGVMISAVDLLKGIAVGSGMKRIVVEGANGGLYTNYEGKARAAVDALCKDGYDFAYIHVEAPDEMGHQGNVDKKVQSIEFLDQRLVKVAKEGMEEQGEDFRMMVLPDHPTPIAVRTHVGDPVPYMLYDSTAPYPGKYLYRERDAKESGIYVAEGYTLIDHLLQLSRRSRG